jgi:predicted transcriptional regulator
MAGVVRVGADIPEELWIRMKKLAAEKRKTLSEIIKEAIVRYVDVEEVKAEEKKRGEGDAQI